MEEEAPFSPRRDPGGLWGPLGRDLDPAGPGTWGLWRCFARWTSCSSPRNLGRLRSSEPARCDRKSPGATLPVYTPNPSETKYSQESFRFKLGPGSVMAE